MGPDDLARQQWDREQVHELFDDLQFRVLRERLFASVAAARARGRGGLRRLVHPAGCRRGRAVARRARPRRRARRCRVPRPVGTRDGRAHRPRAGLRRRHVRLPRPRAAQPGRRPGARRVARRPGRAEGRPRHQGPGARPARAPLDDRRRHQRHAARGVPAQARPAHLRAVRPRAALPAPRAAQQRRRVRGRGQLTLDGGLDESDDALAEVETLHATAIRDLADAFDAAARRRTARPGCSPTSNCR